MAKSPPRPPHVFGSPVPAHAPAHAVLLGQARALHQAGRLPEAERLYRDVLRVRPRSAEALHGLGVLALQAGHPLPATELIAQALVISPGDADAHANLGVAWLSAGRPAEALASVDRALALAPANAQAQGNRGLALNALERHEEALEALQPALAAWRGDAELHYAHGNVLLALRRAPEAVEAYGRCLALAPAHLDARLHRGNAWRALRRHDEAIADYDAVLATAPAYAGAVANRADALMEARRHAEAAAAYTRLLELDAAAPYAAGKRLHARAMACDWHDWDAQVAAIEAGLAEGRRVIEPFAYSAIAREPLALRRCATLFADDQYPPRPPRVPRGHRYPGHARVRLGYLCGEFRNQATTLLAIELWELRDRERFELVAFDNSWDDDSALRRRIEGAFDEIVDISQLSDDAAAAEIVRRETDVLVNLNGWFGLGRTGVFARRPAPLQVNFLGFPGTLGAPYLDVLVADAVIVPEGEEGAYVERVVRLPRCYQPNDRQRAIAPRVPTREEAGLPPQGVVFACFNNTYKILPAMFAAWMRILRQVEGSVLWLLDDNAEAVLNLRAAAVREGVAPQRLCFAPRLRSSRARTDLATNIARRSWA